MVWRMTIGARIRQAREAKGLTQQALAKAVRVSRPAVSQWEDGTSTPRPKKLPSIAEALDVDPIWLSHGEGFGGARPMPVRGEVAAGTFREAVDLDMEPIPVAPMPEYPADAQYGLLVRGTSLNKIARDSEYLVVVDVLKTGLSPRAGDLVIVHRHEHGRTEATAKRLIRSGGKLALRAESDDPQYQAIIPLDRPDLDTEIVITAIVLGKYSAIKRGLL